MISCRCCGRNMILFVIGSPLQKVASATAWLLSAGLKRIREAPAMIYRAWVNAGGARIRAGGCAPTLLLRVKQRNAWNAPGEPWFTWEMNVLSRVEHAPCKGLAPLTKQPAHPPQSSELRSNLLRADVQLLLSLLFQGHS